MHNIADFRFPCFPQNTAGRTAEACGRMGNTNSIYSWGNGMWGEKAWGIHLYQIGLSRQRDAGGHCMSIINIL